jgi:hypothetical protein
MQPRSDEWNSVVEDSSCGVRCAWPQRRIPVRAKLQFVVEGDNFSFNAFEMNGVPSANIIAIAMMGKMCESAT